MDPTPKILIVDDMQDNLQVELNCLFSGGYYNILCSKSGEDALKIVYKELPDLIILDWDMPGVSGIDVLKALKESSASNLIPVIIITGAMLELKDLELALQTGAIYYIRKPFEGNELLARVKSALDFSSMLRTVNFQNMQIEKQNTILKENENRLTALLNASNESCVLVENDIIFEATNTFYTYTGFKKEEVIGHSLYSFFPREFRKLLTEIEYTNKEILTASIFTKDG